MIEISIYQTADGERFDTKPEAERHEEMLRLVKKLEDSAIFWREATTIEVAKWIFDNYHVTPKNKG